MLQAHTYWRMHGLMADLVILNEEAGGYEQLLRERLEGLIQAIRRIRGRISLVEVSCAARIKSRRKT